MRRDVLLLAAIVAVALAVRVYPAWDSVFGGAEVKFLETDAWYHVRLVENQVRNYPWRVTLDPYAAPGGQFVPIAPLYDTLTSTLVIALQGRQATTHAIERIAAFVPPVLGALAVVVTWMLGRRVLGAQAGLLAAALLAVLPGHFMDRTELGFVDHHALEALLALATLLMIVRAVGVHASHGALFSVDASVAGIALGLYLLTWASGAFLLGLLGAWLLALVVLARPDAVTAAARVLLVMSAVAVLLVLIFQDPRMHRYGSQLLGLGGLIALSGLVGALHRGAMPSRARTVGALAIAVASVAAGVWAWRPELSADVVTDLLRFTPDPSRMNVLEARPLFLYAGEWRWNQPWQFFRTGAYVGLAALLVFAHRISIGRRADDLLIWIYTLGTLVATLGQNRFGYYLVPGLALVSGWLCAEVLRWGGWFRARAAATDVPLQREVALAAVLAGVFAPNLAPTTLLMKRSAGLADYWVRTTDWLRERTPSPFQSQGGDQYYYARYAPDVAPEPSYTVMNWWDQGYVILQSARRVPVANPTQARAGDAARFYAETDEKRAAAILAMERSHVVLADWELPFRLTKEGRVMGRFQSVLDWAGGVHASYYEVWYRRESGAWTSVWIFHEPYYRSMAYRLAVGGGAASEPQHASTVVTFADRVDARGAAFRELLTERTYGTYREALEGLSLAGANARIVGLNPWQTAFPIEALRFLNLVHDVRTAGQAASETPWVRIFLTND